MQNRLKWMKNKRILIITTILIIIFSFSIVYAQSNALPIPSIKIEVGKSKDPANTSIIIQILFLLTILTLAPAILIMMTSFTRLIIVFSFLRHALGLHQMPPNQILIGLSLFLTFFIMSPVWYEVKEKAYIPYIEKRLSQEVALDEAIKPVRKFMMKQVSEKDLALFFQISKTIRPKTPDEVPMNILLPAFVISELKIAFQMGFLLFLPFLIIDIVVSSILLSMGMMLLPPMMVSLPFKVILFVLVDGWNLVVGSLVKSFN
ncbi:MAG: flagellar type III secretion system pore protein FliP [Candidatus Jordarchaeum sp.]|uniref:flagellar type III secretion system pore protein FliP n=1 Tax=Candidatus Jordarchaeum sp. TaxID=2823881 RepID=UPI0040492A95